MPDLTNIFSGRRTPLDYVSQAVETPSNPFAPPVNQPVQQGFSGQSNLDDILSAVPQIEGLFGDIDQETAQFRGENQRLAAKARTAFQELNRSDAPTGVAKYVPAALMAIQALGNLSPNEFMQKAAFGNTLDVFNLFEGAKDKKQQAKRQKFIDKFKSLETQATLGARSQAAATSAAQIKGAATRTAITTAAGAQPKGVSARDVSDQLAVAILGSGIPFESWTTQMKASVEGYNSTIYKELREQQPLTQYKEVLADASKNAKPRIDAYMKSVVDFGKDGKGLKPEELDAERKRVTQQFTVEESIRIIEQNPELAPLLQAAKNFAALIESEDLQRQVENVGAIDFTDEVNVAPFIPLGGFGGQVINPFFGGQLEKAGATKRGFESEIEKTRARIRRLRGGQ